MVSNVVEPIYVPTDSPVLDTFRVSQLAEAYHESDTFHQGVELSQGDTSKVGEQCQDFVPSQFSQETVRLGAVADKRLPLQ